MVVFIAKLVVDHDEALGVVRQRQLPRHADAAVQLNAFFCHQSADAAHGDLGGRQCALALGAIVAVHGGRGIDDGGAGLLHFQQQVGHAVLQGLEAANRHTKLLARLQVFQRVLLGHIHGAQRFGTHGQNAPAHGALQRGKALPFRAQQRARADLHVLQRDFGHAATVDAAHAAAGEARGIGRHQEQRDAVFIVHRARGAGAYQQHLRLVTMHHHRLVAGEQPAVAIAHSTGRHAVQCVMCAGLFVRQSHHGAAVDDAGDVFLLRCAACQAQRPAHHQCAQERLHHQATAQGFKHHGHIKARAAKAAIGLREQRANRAQFGKAGPQGGVHTLVAVGNVVAGFDAVLLGHEAVQGVRQHAAVFGMFKVHRGNLTGPRSFLK